MHLQFFIFLILICAVEFYFLQAVKTVVHDWVPSKRKTALYIAYGFMAFNLLIGIAMVIRPPMTWPTFWRFVNSVGFVLLICKLLGCSFLIVDDVVRLFRWIFSLFSKNSAAIVNETNSGAQGISRLKFFSQLAITFTVVPAVAFLYGMIKGAYRYRIHAVKVPSPNLPEAFNGFKIVQLSDIHTGSFLNTDGLEKAFEIVMQQGADMILFTGDLVNNMASETKGFEDTYKKLKAPYGVYSVLGNHDYGDYPPGWESPAAKAKNLQDLKDIQKNCGWKLLLNEHVPLEKNGEQIALIGVENWGGKGFAKYGKLDEAYLGADNYPFKILMSHDPSHWDLQVLKDYPKIDLTLSGHTHGMQFGIEIPGVIKWSPVKYLYKNWAGLYKQGEQFLYVNRGLGFLGYPGRLGIWPEITVMELVRV
jgi:uncharacterized protein